MIYFCSFSLPILCYFLYNSNTKQSLSHWSIFWGPLHSLIRHYLARFNRKTKRYSKAFDMILNSLLILFHKPLLLSILIQQCRKWRVANGMGICYKNSMTRILTEEIRNNLKNSKIELIYLLPYSPNLNPIERLQKFMHSKTTINTYINSIKIKASHLNLSYYRSQPDKYPEVK